MTINASPFNLDTCVRPNILKLVPYRCARDDYKDDGINILLDANENAYGPSLPIASTATETASLHRYPDPHQHALKSAFCALRNTNPARPLTPENLFLGVGSDEVIDALLRCFCTPGKDQILTCPPTYGMYSVSAQVNDISVVTVDLDHGTGTGNFALRADAISAALSSQDNANIKLVYICSPGNPTGALVDPAAVKKLLSHPTWNGVVVVDEAYVDFAPAGSSLAPWAADYPNLVVMQTLSKAFGLAGIRLGAAFTSPPIARLLNNMKAPYTISTPTSSLAHAALSPPGLAVMNANVAKILEQRARLLRELPTVPGVGRFRGGFEANFVLVEILDDDGSGSGGAGKPSNDVAMAVYRGLAETRGVVVRFRGGEKGCFGCLRMTVGTEEENTRLLERLREILEGIYSAKST